MLRIKEIESERERVREIKREKKEGKRQRVGEKNRERGERGRERFLVLATVFSHVGFCLQYVSTKA